MSLPQCIEGCPQHETRVRHKQRHRSRTVSKTRGRQGRRRRVQEKFRGRMCTTDPCSANPRFEGGQGGPGFQESLHAKGQSVVKNTKKASRGSRGVWGGSRGFQGRFRGGPEVLGLKTRNAPTVPTAQQHPAFCAGGSSRPNRSGYPLSVPAVAHSPPPISKVLGGGG